MLKICLPADASKPSNRGSIILYLVSMCVSVIIIFLSYFQGTVKVIEEFQPDRTLATAECYYLFELNHDAAVQKLNLRIQVPGLLHY